MGHGFSSPARYRICVAGHLDSSWQARISDMRILCSDAADRTLLEGSVRDQAELAGVLQTLHDLQLALISLERLGDDEL